MLNKKRSGTHTRGKELILFEQSPIIISRVSSSPADVDWLCLRPTLEVRTHGLDEARLVGLELVRVREQEDGVVVS